MRRFRAALIAAFLAAAPYALAESTPAQPMGLGIAVPEFIPGDVLYLYGQPGPGQLPSDTAPVDSLTFVAATPYVDIGYAPPWLWPEAMKLDYEILMFRAITVTRDWVEVVANHQTGRRAWLDRSRCSVTPWAMFLLGVVAVERIAPPENPLRVKPLDHAGQVTPAPEGTLRPIAVQDSWIQVRVGEPGDEGAPQGWLRWRAGDDLVVRFALLE